MIIYIDEIENLPNKKLEIEFSEIIEDLNLKEPVTGNIVVQMSGPNLNIKGCVQASLSLECDRCLKEYIEKFNIKIDENFIKGQAYNKSKAEIELKIESLVEELGSSNEINLTDLIYQNIILSVPNKKLCDINCKGSDEYQKLQNEKHIDPRLQIFKDLNDKMK